MIIQFVPVKEDHVPELKAILNYYVMNSTATFHQEIIDNDAMREKLFFEKSIHKSFAIICSETVIGYCAIGPWKKQESYNHTAEVTIYLDKDKTGKGIGTAAISFLEQFANQNGVTNLIAGICTENEPSLKLFQKCGFHEAAHFKDVGIKFGRVLSTKYFQKKLGTD